MGNRLCSKLGMALIAVAGGVLLTAATALASGSAQPEDLQVGPSDQLNPATLSVTGMVTPTEPMTGGTRIAHAIAVFFGVPVTEVVGLRPAQTGDLDCDAQDLLLKDQHALGRAEDGL